MKTIRRVLRNTYFLLFLLILPLVFFGGCTTDETKEEPQSAEEEYMAYFMDHPARFIPWMRFDSTAEISNGDLLYFVFRESNATTADQETIDQLTEQFFGITPDNYLSGINDYDEDTLTATVNDNWLDHVNSSENKPIVLLKTLETTGDNTYQGVFRYYYIYGDEEDEEISSDPETAATEILAGNTEPYEKYGTNIEMEFERVETADGFYLRYISCQPAGFASAKPPETLPEMPALSDLPAGGDANFSEAEILDAYQVVCDYFNGLNSWNRKAAIEALSVNRDTPNMIIAEKGASYLVKTIRYQGSGKGANQEDLIRMTVDYELICDETLPTLSPQSSGDYDGWGIELERENDDAPWRIYTQGYA